MENNQQFPTGVYKCSPAGKYPGNGGRRHDLKPAANQSELDLLLGDGYSLSLQAAEEAYDLTKPATGPATPSTSTPEERAVSAEALQADAAARLNQANEALEADQLDADLAEKAETAIEREYAEAAEAKADFDARYADLLARRSGILAHREAAAKTLASSKLRQAAADRALDDAATKVITSSDLVKEAKQKAMDKEVAKRKALAEAQGKDKAPVVDPEPAKSTPELSQSPTEAAAAAPTDPEPAKSARASRAAK